MTDRVGSLLKGSSSVTPLPSADIQGGVQRVRLEAGHLDQKLYELSRQAQGGIAV